MIDRKTVLLTLLAIFVTANGNAMQDNAAGERRQQALREEAQQAEQAQHEAETVRREAELRVESAHKAAATQERETLGERQRVEAEMRRAEARLERAARRIAELSSRQLPNLNGQSWAFEFSGRPVLGITIDGDTDSGSVEGVHVSGVTPGGAAFESGLRAGDIITAINDQSLGADSSAAANGKLLEFMRNVEVDHTLKLEFMREGKENSVELQPQMAAARSFAFPPDAPFAPSPRVMPSPPAAPGVHEFMIWHNDGGWGDMELVALTEDLGRYFGTDKGLLVVRAPTDGDLELQDGDVIHSIDGREPSSIAHAMRILASYQPGETLKLEIMRDKRRRTLEVAIPDERRSATDRTVTPDVRVKVDRRVIRN